MEEPMHLDDYSSRFFFGFLNENNQSVILEKSVGHFELKQIDSGTQDDARIPNAIAVT